jgi:UDP-N-acetylglucosamine 2-epimerase (non-hydrolysing)
VSRARILAVLGTRPEAIKMAPVIRALRRSAVFEVSVCVTGQHREMLDQVLSAFSISPDFDLNVMTPDQSLPHLTASLLCRTDELYRQWRPHLVIVQGDTTTTFAASLVASYSQIPIAHVEAGLRTGDKHSPWPEEVNRGLTTVLATWHYAPTQRARENLLREGIDPKAILVTGNTSVDAVQEVAARLADTPELEARYRQQFSYLDPRRRLLLVTAHRRENLGDRLRRICIALRELAQREDVEVVYPVHLNPNVRRTVYEVIGEHRNVWLIEPQEYRAFIYLLKRCYMIISDSGGVQEEAPFLGKPVLLLRDTTERHEALAAGAVKLVGTAVEDIVDEVDRLLRDAAAYRSMARPTCPFGDGQAALRIARHLESLEWATESPRVATPFIAT